MISDVRQRHKENLPIFIESLHSGRPKIKTKEVCDDICEIALDDPRRSYKQFADELRMRQNYISVSDETIRNVLKNYQFRYLPPMKTFLLTDIQKLNRLNFAKHHLEQQTDWSRAIFVDESAALLNITKHH
jgi:hypothetical protein